MIILGIDPGTATTGYGVIEKIQNVLRCVGYGCFETPKYKTTGERLALLERKLSLSLKAYKPDMAAVEQLFFFKNLKTVMPVSEARGVILLTLAKYKVLTKELSPLQVKMAIVGYGRADKKQMQAMVQKTLGLKELPRPDDAADALAIAISCATLSHR